MTVTDREGMWWKVKQEDGTVGSKYHLTTRQALLNLFLQLLLQIPSNSFHQVHGGDVWDIAHILCVISPVVGAGSASYNNTLDCMKAQTLYMKGHFVLGMLLIELSSIPFLCQLAFVAVDILRCSYINRLSIIDH